MLGGLSPDIEYPYDMILRILLGNQIKVANYHAIDINSGYIWVNGTAPDGEDGTVDGVSEYGALYRLELLKTGVSWSINENFHTSFAGGSATTPAILADGSRIYIGDNSGRLITIDAYTGSLLWQIEMGSQIVGSIAVASDNRELYVSTKLDIFKVVDQGAKGEIIWQSNIDPYNVDNRPNQKNMNMQLSTIGANGIAIQAGAGYQYEKYPLPLKVGVGLLDRETGNLRYFTDGIEESIACIQVGPDGFVYIAHSPLRRAMSRALFRDITDPVTGGIAKYAGKRLDLLIRDAVNAAADRLHNFVNQDGLCSSGAENADIKQIKNLIDQCRRAAPQAMADGDLSSAVWVMLEGYLSTAEKSLGADFDSALLALQQASTLFND